MSKISDTFLTLSKIFDTFLRLANFHTVEFFKITAWKNFFNFFRTLILLYYFPLICIVYFKNEKSASYTPSSIRKRHISRYLLRKGLKCCLLRFSRALEPCLECSFSLLEGLAEKGIDENHWKSLFVKTSKDSTLFECFWNRINSRHKNHRKQWA